MTALLAIIIIVIIYDTGEYFIAKSNYKRNRQLERTDSLGFINGQALGIYKNYRYGLFTNGRNTCETIAVHNAKVYLGISSTLSQTIYDVQKCRGMWLFGTFGTLPFRTDEILDSYKIGYKRVKKPQEMTEEGMYIISFWVKRKMAWGMHTVAVVYDGQMHTAYNLYSNRREIRRIIPNDYEKTFICGYYLGKPQ